MDNLFPPASALQPYIEGYWLRSGTYDPPKKVRVLADACTKLIFELERMPWGSAYLIGTQVAPIVVSLSGKVDRVGIRFRPGAASFLLHRNLDGLSGRLTPLDQLGITDGEAVISRLLTAGDGAARATMLDHWLLARLRPGEAGRSEFEETMQVSRLLRAGLSPPEVAARMDWPERRLQRVCRDRFGAPAVSLHRLYRFELLQRRLLGEPVELAALAAEIGFSDQAHMARDFRHFAHTTISAFIRERVAVGNVQDAADWLPVLRDLPGEAE